MDHCLFGNARRKPASSLHPFTYHSRLCCCEQFMNNLEIIEKLNKLRKLQFLRSFRANRSSRAESYRHEMLIAAICSFWPRLVSCGAPQCMWIRCVSCQIEPIRFALEFISTRNAVHNFTARSIAKTPQLTYIHMSLSPHQRSCIQLRNRSGGYTSANIGNDVYNIILLGQSVSRR